LAIIEGVGELFIGSFAIPAACDGFFLSVFPWPDALTFLYDNPYHGVALVV
jgi:hypothetical protein